MNKEPYHEYPAFFVPQLDDWECQLFGMGPSGITVRPRKGNVPNRFWRWMQYLCFGNKWVRVPK